jgi:peroxiredoxin
VSKATSLLLAAAGLWTVPLSAQASALAIGSVMPATQVKLENIDGHQLSLAQVAGKKGTLVIFSCNHCPWVKAWQERLVAIGNAAVAAGVGVVAVNSNDPKVYPADDMAAMKEQARDRGYRFPYAMDTTSKLGRAFGATHTPEVFLFDAAGRLVYHGTIDDDARDPANVKHRYLRDALDAVVAGKQPKIQETKALGCSIVFRKQ